ncbi:MAG: hypothetical protein ACI4OP_01375 [Candidatus Coprovivens sp.]|mgnify:FL=1|jgi:hypothetical protein
MNLAEYMKNECEKATLNENTSQLGYTDVFSGSNWMGPHRHDYVIWNEFGYGYTSDAIAAPDCQGQASVGGHVHQIVDGKVWPAGDGHTHTLNAPLQVATDTHIGDAKLEDPTGQPQVAPTIVLHQ